MTTSDTQMNFEATKPDILIVNQDANIGITQNLSFLNPLIESIIITPLKINKLTMFKKWKDYFF